VLALHYMVFDSHESAYTPICRTFVVMQTGQF